MFVLVFVRKKQPEPAGVGVWRNVSKQATSTSHESRHAPVAQVD